MVDYQWVRISWELGSLEQCLVKVLFLIVASLEFPHGLDVVSLQGLLV